MISYGKRLLTTLAAWSILLICNPLTSSTAFGADTYAIDPAHSTIIFRVNHLGVSHLYGRFNQPEGTLDYDRKKTQNSAIEIRAKVENIDTYNQKRDLHLKSPEFFDVAKYPLITFKSRRVTAKDNNRLEIQGDLSLHGVTRTVTVEATLTGMGKDPWGGNRIGFESSFPIKRSDFKMAGMLGPVGDDVLITVSVEGIRK